jgi:hypothetical protein
MSRARRAVRTFRNLKLRGGVSCFYLTLIHNCTDAKYR